MKFEELLNRVGNQPLFESSVLLAGDVEPASLWQQLTRWTSAGKLRQLRRGLYAISEPYRRKDLHPFLVANALVRPSYVSLQSALRHHGMIPEHVPTTTSVTSRRPIEYETDFGGFLYRHVDPSCFWGYDTIEIDDITVFVASPEKALLDLVYLQPGGDDPGFLESLRLQNLEVIDVTVLGDVADRWGKPKLSRAAEVIRSLVEREDEWSEL